MVLNDIGNVVLNDMGNIVLNNGENLFGPKQDKNVLTNIASTVLIDTGKYAVLNRI